MKLIPIDFEFNCTNEKYLNLVSASLEVNGTKHTFWLHKNKEAYGELRKLILSIPQPFAFLCYAATAEARALMSLELAPLDFKYVDLYLEYRCLLNSNHSLAYGEQLMDGKIKTTKPPSNKYHKTQEEDEDDDRSKPQYGLAAACFKLLGKRVDTERKDRIRDLIISRPEEFSPFEQEEILEYNESDIDLLPDLFTAMRKQYEKLLAKRPENLKTLKDEMLLRGEYGARTAIMESLGYPIDVESTRSFTSQVPSILFQCQKEITELFPHIKPFRLEKYQYVMDTKAIRDWIATTPYATKWMKTDGGKKGIKQASLKKDAFLKFYNVRHEFKETCLGEQMVRFLNLKQNLNGFMPGGKAGSFWDYVGSDGRVRPYFGIYGAQSARSQPKATGFLFLKSAWVRSLEAPRPGRAIAGIDYKSQEFLLAALLSSDPNMIASYKSGDPYLYLAKLAGEVPWGGDRKDYEDIRNKFKSTNLGINYSMTKIGLAVKLTMDTGKKTSELDAQKLIDLFNKKYFKNYMWKHKMNTKYQIDKFIKLPCGWYLWGDNKNDRSSGNMRVQGLGSSIMRKAVALAQDAGLDVIKTLHDAIYIEYDSFDFEKIDLLGRCMDEAFRYYFPADKKKDASVGLEANTWSPDYALFEGMSETPAGLELKVQGKYLDKRGAKEYEKFKQYLTPLEFSLD